MGRTRDRRNRHLPANLYTTRRGSRVYYRYRHPVTKKEHGVGTDLDLAIEAAELLNERHARPTVRDVIARIEGTSTPLSEWIDGFLTSYAKKGRAANTEKQIRLSTAVIRERIGTRNTQTLSTGELQQFLDTFPPVMADKHRATLIMIYRWAIGRDLTTRNVAEHTEANRQAPKRKRLDEAAFWAIYAQAPGYLQRAMALALVTGQRRGDLLRMKFSDIRDGVLYWEQEKTKWKGGMPVEGFLAEVIAACRATGAVSEYLIHHATDIGRARAGQKIKLNRITQKFAQIRDATGLFDGWEDGTRPTFHEIRSLAGRLADAAGHDPQKLLGHLSRATTDRYLNRRGSEYIRVEPWPVQIRPGQN